jgi:hypothetical protein
MKTVIFGSRKIAPYKGAPKEERRLIDPQEILWIFSILDSYHLHRAPHYPAITEVVTGMAQGADCAGFAWGSCMMLPIKAFYPDWKKHGKKAGFLRNTEMALYADRGICFYDGYSNGTKHMLGEMKRLNKHVIVFRLHFDGKHDPFPCTLS